VSAISFDTTAVPGLLVVHPRASADARGTFAKSFLASDFAEAGLATTFAEEYHTSSARGVVRGMHFQTPPHDHDKVVFCVCGRVFDAVLDLRPSSPAYGTAVTFELSGPDGPGLYIPAGCAHGFAALTDGATMTYKVTTAYAPEHDAGILWSSVPGVTWPDSAPVVSERDAGFPAFADFVSPFTNIPEGSAS